MTVKEAMEQITAQCCCEVGNLMHCKEDCPYCKNRDDDSLEPACKDGDVSPEKFVEAVRTLQKYFKQQEVHNGNS